MKRSRVLAIALACLLVLSVASPARAEDTDDSEYDDEEPAMLIVRKSFADESPAAINRAATVVLSVHNSGERQVPLLDAPRRDHVKPRLALARAASGAGAADITFSVTAGRTVFYKTAPALPRRADAPGNDFEPLRLTPPSLSLSLSQTPK
jgi:hypothetical protein